MRRRSLFCSILVLSLALPAVAAGVNSSIHVDSGEVVDDDLTTVNGRVQIGDGVTVRGDAKSVNGKVLVGQNVRVDSVSTVNGGIRIGEGTVVAGDVETVNGPISMEFGSRAREVGTVNGSVELIGVEVEADVSTYNGDVTLRNGSIVGADIRIRESNSHSDRRKPPLRITIADGSTVHGDVVVEDEDRKVEVYLRGGTVAGQVLGATIVEE